MAKGLLDWFRGSPEPGDARKPLAIIGLGNPGPKYAASRHNVGFMCVDQLASRFDITLKDKRKTAVLGEGRIDSQPVVLVQPRTFMNNSGEAVRYVLDRYRIPRQSILVIFDDIDLPLGRIRLRASGGSGGHNGLKSINASVGAEDYSRLRIGVSRPQGNTISHVLTTFTSEERPVVNETLAQAVNAAEAWVTRGIGYAMDNFN